MLILVINCGSSSVKLALFRPNNSTPIATGVVDSIGSESIEGHYRVGDNPRQSIECPTNGDHAAAPTASGSPRGVGVCSS